MVTCEVCWEALATRECPLCGRHVCDNDFDAERGVCKLCSSTLCRFCGRRLSIGYCAVCGRLGCDECLVQLDSVRRVCRECLRSLGGRRKVAELLRTRRTMGPLRVTRRIIQF